MASAAALGGRFGAGVGTGAQAVEGSVGGRAVDHREVPHVLRQRGRGVIGILHHDVVHVGVQQSDGEVAAPVAMSLPAVSKHLKVLERAQLIARGKEAQWRPCELKAEPLREADAWIEQYRQMWEERFDRLDALAAETKATLQQIEEPDRRTKER